jgi:hypothetical protein
VNVTISLQIRFKSPPRTVRRAIMDYVADRYPKAVDYFSWDPTGTRATGKKMGASGSLELTGDGPTTLDIQGKLGFPASLMVTEEQVRDYLDEAIRELKARTP